MSMAAAIEAQYRPQTDAKAMMFDRSRTMIGIHGRNITAAISAEFLHP
jgi:hypothetical protein